MNKTGLGKGLSALIPAGTDYLDKDEPVNEIDLELIQPNSFQPRRAFDAEKLTELANSIREHGVVQPVVIRPLRFGKYELVVGERRLRACQQLQVKTIPAVIKEFTNEQMMEIALVENIQRENLNPVEEAYAYKKLMGEFKLTQEQVAQKVSKSRSFVANMVRLLNLPDAILQQLSQNQLTIGHARPLLALDNDEMKIKLAREIIDKNLSVRDTESMIKSMIEEKNRGSQSLRAKVKKLPPTLLEIESRLRSICGTKVTIKDLDGKGRIEIDYYNEDDLERIMSLFLKDGLDEETGGTL